MLNGPRSAALERYRTSGHRAVEGWLNQLAADVICELAEVQHRQGIVGPVCEIGVHHGRLFILLHLLSAPNERSLAIDLFEMQDENVDQSGQGSRERLIHNLRVHACDVARIELLAENSLRLGADRIVELCGGHPRLFSIDGGHTAEATCNDLALAHEVVCDGGLVILDDYFNPSWPAVSEGACEFMRRYNKHFMPVAITSNKFFFTKGDTAGTTYRRRIQGRLGAKVSHVFGHEVVCFEPPTLRERVVSSRIWLSVRETSLGRTVRILKRWI